MADRLKPGTGADFAADTMARAMEDAFRKHWQEFNPDKPKPEGEARESLRLFFVAVAQGVVQHLRDNPEAFKVDVQNAAGDGGHDHQARMQSIETTGMIEPETTD